MNSNYFGPSTVKFLDFLAFSIRNPRHSVKVIIPLINGKDVIYILLASCFITLLSSNIGFLFFGERISSSYEALMNNWGLKPDIPVKYIYDIGTFFRIFLGFLFLSFFGWVIGRIFEGSKNYLDIAKAVSWYYLLISIISPVETVISILSHFTNAGGGIFLFLFMVISIFKLWILSSCIAEAHKTLRTIDVASVIFVMMFCYFAIIMFFLM